MRVILGILLLLPSITYSQVSNFIHVDQFGYLSNSEKVAVISDPQIGFNSTATYTPGTLIELRDAQSNAVVYSSAPSAWSAGATHGQSGDRGWWFDFSSYTSSGSYYVHDPSTGESSPEFTISASPYNDVMETACRMFYYNRCNFAKQTPFADANYTDALDFVNAQQDANCAYVYDSTNINLEKDLTGGWYDAGDYNKYVTFAHAAVHNLLSAQQQNPQAFGDANNIPESSNNIPDILDEIKWELDWLIKMSNPDGSTHIKMGSKNHSQNVSSPPSANTHRRFYGSTCSAASAAIASMFSHASLVYQNISGMSAYALTLESTAVRAFNHVDSVMQLNALDSLCDDGSIVSGDADWSSRRQRDAMIIAAVYLYELTGNLSYQQFLLTEVPQTEQLATPFWGGYLMPLNDALLHYTTLSGADSVLSQNIRASFIGDVNANWSNYYGFNNDDLYRADMPDWSYHWGSNQVKASYGSLNKLIVEHSIMGNSTTYNRKAAEQLHYFHGVNPLGVVYMSNMYADGAERSINEIYHLWFADGTAYDNAQTSLYGPAPGYVPGGCNQQYSGSVTPPASQPRQKSYFDFNNGWPDNSWEISEPAIYYQACYIRLLSYFVDNTITTSVEPTKNFEVSVFPNPTGDILIIDGLNGNASIEIMDNLGRSVYLNMTQEKRKQVDVSALANGVYYVKLLDQDNDHQYAKRIVIR